MSTLPTEIIEEILSFLPPKSLCRFKSVAKSWHFLITSDAFIKLHLSKTLISQPANLIICDDSLSSAAITAANPNYLSFSDVYHPLSSTFRFIGSCRGILCIYNRYNNTAFFNPITKTHRLIPSTKSRYDVVVALGFGYDSSVDDYKLLRIIDCHDLKINPLDFDRIYREIGLYSMRSNSWKIVNDDFGKYSIQQANVVHVNGVLYFPVNKVRFVKCFDLKTEEFSVFEMFELDKSFENYFIVSVELGGCFAVMANYAKANWLLSCVELWVRNDVSWVRVFRVSDLSKMGKLTHIRPVVYSKDGGRVLLELNGLKFCWFDWHSNEFKEVEACGLPTTNPCFDTYTFVPSLVSLRSDEDKANDERKENRRQFSRD